ncbi:MAG: response regulator [Elusimicrobia bacterium]|nr:response regulator [Elusimicrobiota bacterium]
MYRILAVEDDSLMTNMLRHVICAEGFEFFTCAEGGSASELAVREKPDLIILDVHLPDMDGHEVCRRLKADARVRHIPVIMLTGEAREVESRVRGLDLGAEDYLFKPISPKVLVARIKSILKPAPGPQ